MTEARSGTVEVTWEVWRSHAKGGPDVSVLRHLSKTAAEQLLRECVADGELRGFCDFYLVKATTTREEWRP